MSQQPYPHQPGHLQPQAGQAYPHQPGQEQYAQQGYQQPYRQQGYQQPYQQPGYGPMAIGPTKSHAAAILLSFFLGTLGVDRFYLGHVGLGIAKLLLSWATFGVWQIIDFILIIVKGTNGLKQINWQ